MTLKFEINRDVLLHAISGLGRLTNSLTPNIKIEAISSDRIKLSAYDMRIGEVITLNAIDVSGDAITISAKKFIEVISKLDGKISFDDGIIKSGKNKIKLPVGTADEILPVPNVANKSEIDIEANILIEALKKTVYAASDIGADVLAGIKLISGEFAAVDGNILAISKIDIELDSSVVLPKLAANEIVKTFEGITDKAIIKVDSSLFSITVGDITIVSNLREGMFPKYQQLIPTYDDFINVDKKEILKAIDIINVVKNEHTKICKLKFEDNTLSISASDDDSSEGLSVIDVDYDETEPFEIAFNIEFLRKCINSIDSDVIRFEHGSSLQGVLLKGNDKDLCLLMPVQVR